MTESDTPETDAAIVVGDGVIGPRTQTGFQIKFELNKEWVFADLARSLERRLTLAQARVAELEKLLGEAQDNLIWCGGAADFGWGGKAQVGYDKGPRTTIAAIYAALKDRA